MNYSYYLNECYSLAQRSPDTSTQNAAILLRGRSIVASGVNCFTEGIRASKELLERPMKYTYIEHAERNAVYDAAAKGVKTEGLTMVCPWAACADCARAIVNSGIVMLVRHKQAGDRSPERWKESIEHADRILRSG